MIRNKQTQNETPKIEPEQKKKKPTTAPSTANRREVEFLCS